jgi:heat shock protein HslJ
MSDLDDLLERSGDRTAVRPAPIEEMVTHARRVHRRRTALVSVTAVAVVVLGALAIDLVRTADDPRRPVPATGSPSEAATATEPVDLEGTWRVRALVGSDGHSVLPKRYRGKVVMTFDDGKLTATTGCNDVFGSYRQSGAAGGDLIFPHGDLGSTLVGCSDEPPLVSRLVNVRHVSIAGDTMTLHAADGTTLVDLRRR